MQAGEKRRKFLESIEKRARKRERLLSLKRYSGLLKRPEILETVYSVESEDGEREGAGQRAEQQGVGHKLPLDHDAPTLDRAGASTGVQLHNTAQQLFRNTMQCTSLCI